MKKAFAALTALVLALLLPFGAMPVFAADVQTENGFRFQIEETEDGPALKVLSFTGTGDVTVPKTLGAVELKPENLTGSMFYYRSVTSFTVEEDNSAFCVKNGALCSKDGETLIFCPPPLLRGVWSVPAGVRNIGGQSLRPSELCCVAVPDSVETLASNCCYQSNTAFAGSPGSAAETFAASKSLRFVALGEDHAHCYFRTATQPTCQETGRVLVICPCGDVALDQTLDPVDHRFVRSYDYSTAAWKVYCSYCGVTWEEYQQQEEQTPQEESCACLCHELQTDPFPDLNMDFKVLLRHLIFRLKLAVWRLTGTHQICECGARHY